MLEHVDWHGHQVRAYTLDTGERWYVGRDILTALGSKYNITYYTQKLAPGEYRRVTRNEHSGLFGQAKGNTLVMISEAGAEKLRPKAASTSVHTMKFLDHDIRVVPTPTQVWLVAKDVLKALNLLVNDGVMHNLDKLNPEERFCYQRNKPYPESVSGLPKFSEIVPHAQVQYINLITKAGAYKLAMRSDKPEAKRFQDWLAYEVLPEIEATGSYNPAEPVTAPVISDFAKYATLLRQEADLVDEYERAQSVIVRLTDVRAQRIAANPFKKKDAA